MNFLVLKRAALRDLAKKLEKEGWFERSVYGEMKLLLPIVLMLAVGTYIATTHPIIASILIGVAMQQAGWLGHDMDHARNSPYNRFMLRYARHVVARALCALTSSPSCPRARARLSLTLLPHRQHGLAPLRSHRTHGRRAPCVVCLSRHHIT